MWEDDLRRRFDEGSLLGTLCISPGQKNVATCSTLLNGRDLLFSLRTNSSVWSLETSVYIQP